MLINNLIIGFLYLVGEMICQSNTRRRIIVLIIIQFSRVQISLIYLMHFQQVIMEQNFNQILVVLY